MMSWCYYPRPARRLFTRRACLTSSTYMHHDKVSVTIVCCWLRPEGRDVLTWLCFVNSLTRGWLESSTTEQGSY